MELAKFIQKASKTNSTKIILAAILSGLANGFVVVIINISSQNISLFNFKYLLMFITCIAIYILAKRYALIQTSTNVRTAITHYHLKIGEKIRNADLIQFETYGKNRIRTVLTENTELIFEASKMLIHSLTSASMLFFSFMYIAILSMPAFWFTLILVVLGVGYFVVSQNMISDDIQAANKTEEVFFDSLDHILSGFKEVKINKRRSDDLFLNHISPLARATNKIKNSIESKFITDTIFTQIFFYILIAAVIFVLPKIQNTAPELIIQLTATILFIVGPLGQLVDSAPAIMKANASLFKIMELDHVFDNQKLKEEQLNNDYSAACKFSDFKSLDARNISFSYPAHNGSYVFGVGPLDFSIKKGELVFVIGGNGSGKTTFMKMLTHLYEPSEGDIFVNDARVNSHDRGQYRDIFSIILADFHLFDRIYGLPEYDQDKLLALLQLFKLDHKVTCINGKFSNTNLSTGQKKRLALLVELMMDKSVYIFDEVAADQDPGFRKMFYEKILLDLKKEGKSIIAVSHDDKFFHLADRVLKMDQGKIVPYSEGDNV